MATELVTEVPLYDYLDYLPAYDLSVEATETLELARMVTDSDNYYWMGAVFPQSNKPTIGPLENFEGNLNIPWGSILLNITAWSNQTAGFKWQLYDQGAKHSIFGRTFGRDSDVGQMGVGENVPSGPYWLRSPYIILKPGQLQFQVTNLANVNAIIQLFCAFAVPVARETMNMNVQKKLVDTGGI